MIWGKSISVALQTGVLTAGQASKLAGQLSFAAQTMFQRFGRAMVRPLFAQQYSPLPNGRVGPRLEMALQWWQQVLRMELSQEIPLDLSKVEVCIRVCRAFRVLCTGRRWWIYFATHVAGPQGWLRF